MTLSIEENNIHIWSLKRIVSQANFKIMILCQLYLNNEKFINGQLEDVTDKRIMKIEQSETQFEKQLELIRCECDYYTLSSETQDILSNYLLVASFSIYERALKDILDLTQKNKSTTQYNCYKKAVVIKLLREINIEYESLQDSNNIEELRCLNNAIKHTGHVGSELVTANPKWVLNLQFENTYADFARLMDAPKNVLTDLIYKLGQQH